MMIKRFSIALGILMLGAARHAAAQEVVRPDPGGVSVTAEPSNVVPSPTVEQVHLRFGRFQNLLSLSGADRQKGLEELVGGNDEDLAVLAARQLITDRTPGEQEKIIAQISGWSERDQIILLEELRSGVGDALDIPRQVLRNSIQKPAMPKYGERPSAAVDLAAILVARQASAADRQLLVEALGTNPNTRGLWLAARSLALIGAAQRELALTTWHNERLPSVVRASAATALIGTDSGAEPFVVNTITSVFAGASVSGPMTVLDQLAMIGLIEFLPLRSANTVLTSLLGESRGMVDSAIFAVALVKTSGSLAGKDVPAGVREYVGQHRTGLYLGF